MKYMLRILRLKWLRWSMGFLLMAALLYLSLRDVPPQEVWRSLQQADSWLLLAALASVAINTAAKLARWMVMTKRGDASIPTRDLLAALLIGQTVNWFAPGRLGDLSRVYLAGRRGGSRSFLLGTLAIEKVIDLLAYAMLFLAIILLLPMPDWLADSGVTLTLLAIFLSLTIGLVAARPGMIEKRLPWLLGWLPEKWRAALQPRLQMALSSLGVLRLRGDVIRLVGLTVLVWGTAVWTNDLVLRSLGLGLPWKASVLVLVALQAGISIPVVPGRFGLFEYMCILSLSVYGVAESLGLSFGLLLHAIVLAPTSLASLVAYWMVGVRLRELPQVETG